MELQASRSAARVGPNGDPIPLADQNRAAWDHALIQRGLSGLERAEALGGKGPYALQAAIASCHARAETREATDWARIAELYHALARVDPSPVVEVNRAVAVSMAYGPLAGLDIIQGLIAAPALRSYPFLPAVHGDMLYKLGRFEQASSEFVRAAELTRNARERGSLLARARACEKAR
jgi:predicted RNA polymerase sigma factor